MSRDTTPVINLVCKRVYVVRLEDIKYRAGFDTKRTW